MSWRVSSSAFVAEAVFVGHLSAKDGRESAEAFAKELSKLEVADVIFDVREMTGYDREARMAWQIKLTPLRERIIGIRIVGGNAIVKMGASVLALALGVELSFEE